MVLHDQFLEVVNPQSLLLLVLGLNKDTVHFQCNIFTNHSFPNETGDCVAK